MTEEETVAVRKACSRNRIPCVMANLGQQPEFTSKVIDVIHGHNSFGRLIPAVQRLTEGMCPPSQLVERRQRSQSRLWVFVPQGGTAQDLAVDSRKRDGCYEIPRCCISHLWCSKGEHSRHLLSFVFSNSEVLTVSPKLVTCLKMQHRAAPTERNLVNALRVGFGDQSSDPTLVVDDECVTLSKVSSLVPELAVVADLARTLLVDIRLGGEEAGWPCLQAYASELPELIGSESSRMLGSKSDVILLLWQSKGRDFPKGFREALVAALQPADRNAGRNDSAETCWRQFSVPQMSTNAAISLFGHYWDTHALLPALAHPTLA